jgi:hypothetical protein
MRFPAPPQPIYFTRMPELDDLQFELDAYREEESQDIVYVGKGENPHNCIFND